MVLNCIRGSPIKFGELNLWELGDNWFFQKFLKKYYVLEIIHDSKILSIHEIN
jgi:hypothetical protein